MGGFSGAFSGSGGYDLSSSSGVGGGDQFAGGGVNYGTNNVGGGSAGLTMSTPVMIVSAIVVAIVAIKVFK